MSVKHLYSRTKPFRSPAKIIYLFCEGEKTEPIYFRMLSRKFRDLLRDKYSIQIKDTCHTDPLGIINDALQLKIESGDIIWCVFDMNGNTDTSIKEAVQKAGKKINIALSNPCFELWFILHYDYSTAPLHTKEAISKIKEYIPKYKKNCDVINTLTSVTNSLPTAIKNAKLLESYHITAGNELFSTSSNPSTQVFKILELLGISNY